MLNSKLIPFEKFLIPFFQKGIKFSPKLIPFEKFLIPFLDKSIKESASVSAS